MSAAVDRYNFINALVEYGRLGVTQKMEIQQDYINLYAMQKEGKGKQLVKTEINGKVGQWETTMAAEEKFGCYGEAVRILNRTRKTKAQAIIASF